MIELHHVCAQGVTFYILGYSRLLKAPPQQLLKQVLDLLYI